MSKLSKAYDKYIIELEKYVKIVKEARIPLYRAMDAITDQDELDLAIIKIRRAAEEVENDAGNYLKGVPKP